MIDDGVNICTEEDNEEKHGIVTGEKGTLLGVTEMGVLGGVLMGVRVGGSEGMDM